MAGSVGVSEQAVYFGNNFLMPKYFAFLRAINVGGHNVKMEELRSVFESLSLNNVETFIASGNVIFETRSKNAKALKTRVEEGLRASLGYEIATFLRTDKELTAISRYRPFPVLEIESATTLCIGFVEEPLSAEAQKSLVALTTEIDRFHFHEREVYWLSRVKQSESTFSNAVFERMLKGKATFRSVTTIRKLAAKYLSS